MYQLLYLVHIFIDLNCDCGYTENLDIAPICEQMQLMSRTLAFADYNLELFTFYYD